MNQTCQQQSITGRRDLNIDLCGFGHDHRRKLGILGLQLYVVGLVEINSLIFAQV